MVQVRQVSGVGQLGFGGALIDRARPVLQAAQSLHQIEFLVIDQGHDVLLDPSVRLVKFQLEALQRLSDDQTAGG